jgi:stress-induced morphogen
MSARTDDEATKVQATSGVTPDGIEKKLKDALGAEYVAIADLSGMYIVYIPPFTRKSRIFNCETEKNGSIKNHINRLTTSTGGCGQMYEAIIVSPQFTKKTTLARHRLVNAALKEEIAAIHAWTPKCHTPEEWERKKPQ